MSQGKDASPAMKAERLSSVKRTRLIFLGLLLAVSVLRVWYSTTLPLTGDEAYHWEWSRNLAGGYYDHPPMTAYVIRCTTALLGSTSEAGVRLGAVLLLGGAAVAVYVLARIMARDSGISCEGSEKAGWTAGLLAVTVPMFAGMGVYMSTDPPVIFFCSLSILCSYVAMTRGGWLPWIGVGLAIGLSLLSKFLCLFTFGGMFLFLIISRKDWKWFIKPQPYVAALVALLVFSPFLLWNYANDWATFKFNLVTRQSENAFAPKYFPEFIGSQMLAVGPVFFVLAVGGMLSAWKGWRKEGDRAYLYLLSTCGVPLAYFLFTSFRRRVGLHWPACGWLPLLVLLPLLHVRGKLGLRWIRITLWSSLVLTILVHSAANMPTSMLKKIQEIAAEDGEPVRFEDERVGWREMGGWVDAARTWMVKDQEDRQRGVFLMTGQYGVSAALAFYMPGQPRVHLWAPRRTHGEHYRFWDDFPSMATQDAIYVAKNEEKATGAMRTLQRHFVYVHDPEKLPIMVGGEEVRSFYLIKCFIYDGKEPDFSL